MRVRVSPLQPHCFAFGGFEIQMLSALEAARAAGAEVARLDPWSRDSEFDVLHVWGLELAHLQTVRWAKAAGKKVVMTALLPYLTPRAWLGRAKSWLAGRARAQFELLGQVDALVVVNQRQADTAHVMYGVDRGKIYVAPNIIEPIFFEQLPSQEKDSSVGYVLCTGNVCRRKNQVILAKACIEAGLDLLLIGDVLTGEEAYAEELQRLVHQSTHIRWMLGMPSGSLQLAGAYRAARCFALISHQETQPISLLEAAATGSGLVIANRPYARQEFYANAALADETSVSSVAVAIRRAWQHPDKFTPARHILDRCTKDAVGRTYAEIYEGTLTGRKEIH